MAAPSLSTEAAAAGTYPSTRFNQRERKMLESVRNYVDSLSPDTVITAQGDLIIGDASGDAERLALGASDEVLRSDGTTLSWGKLTDDNIDDFANIAYNKLDLTDQIVSGDLKSGVELELQGTFVTTKDNASSFRLRGPQHSSEGSAEVQSYAGIFYNAGYDTKGTLKTRAIFGANLEMDLELQSPHALLLTAVDGSQADGKILAASRTAMEVHCRADAEVISPKHLVVDRATTGSTGAANTSDVVVKANSGNLRLNYGIVDGTIVIPTLTTAERDALAALPGMLIFNSTSGALEGYDGAWKALA